MVPSLAYIFFSSTASASGWESFVLFLFFPQFLRSFGCGLFQLLDLELSF